MGGIVVLDVVLLVLVVVVVLGRIGFRRVGRTCRTVAFIPAQRNGERTEAALAEHILAGRLHGTDYQRRMAEIAAADHLRHPVAVPRD
jgi:membrane protein required for beta-lactamase induction